MKNCRKIIYFLDFPFWVGGSNKVLLTQAYIMKQKGYQVMVVIPNDGGKHSEEYDRICDEYALERITANYTVAVCMEEIDVVAALEEYQDLVMLLQTISPDLIHSVQLNIAVELAARELGIPHLMNIYQADRQTFHVKWMEVYPRYHSADSNIMSERWGKGLQIPSKCIRVAYAAKDKVDYHLKEKRDIHILSIGALCDRKNQFESIKFIYKCKKCGFRVRLIILGDDQNAYGDRCKRFVEENGLCDNVYFLGFVPCVEKYFKDADLFILSSTVESYPGVVVESMANGVPVIATPVAGVPELLKNEKNGFLAVGYGEDDLYAAFLRYFAFRKSGRIRLIIENAHRTYLEQHSYERVGSELENYYQWIVNDFLNRNV